MKSRRGQELVLWAALHAANYYYIIQYGFQDDGIVTFRAGATGHNLPRSPDVSHMHNTCWRVNVNLGGTGKNSVYAVTHEELPQDVGKAKEHEQLLGVEGPGEWHAREFTFLRVKPHKVPAVTAREGIEAFVQQEYITSWRSITTVIGPWTH
jgi:Copper amine oxidase, enzyme domain